MPVKLHFYYQISRLPSPLLWARSIISFLRHTQTRVYICLLWSFRVHLINIASRLEDNHERRSVNSIAHLLYKISCDAFLARSCLINSTFLQFFLESYTAFVIAAIVDVVTPIVCQKCMRLFFFSMPIFWSRLVIWALECDLRFIVLSATSVITLGILGIISNTSLIGAMAAAEDAKRYNGCDCYSLNHNLAIHVWFQYRKLYTYV